MSWMFASLTWELFPNFQNWIEKKMDSALKQIPATNRIQAGSEEYSIMENLICSWTRNSIATHLGFGCSDGETSGGLLQLRMVLNAASWRFEYSTLNIHTTSFPNYRSYKMLWVVPSQ